MAKLIERYNFGGLAGAYITHGKNNLASKPSYTNWFNRCAIGSTATLPAARREMFKYLMRRSHDLMMEALNRAAVLETSRAAILKRFGKDGAADRQSRNG